MKLSFANLRVHLDKILEIEVFEGIVLDALHVQELQDFALEYFDNRFGLLINRTSIYSHSNNSFEEILQWDERLVAVAIVDDDICQSQLQDIYERIYKLRTKHKLGHFDEISQATDWLIKRL